MGSITGSTNARTATVASRRVLHLLESGGLYGAERVVLALSDRMRAAGEFEPVVGCMVQRPDEPSALYDEARRLGFEAERLVLRNFRLALDVPRVARRLRDLRIGLVHSHGYKATVYGSAMRWLEPFPLTATCHLWFVAPDSPFKMKAMVALEMRLYRRFRTVVAVSADIKRTLVQSGVPEDSVRVIPNGIAPGPPRPSTTQRRALRAALGAADGDFLVLSAGRLTPQKDQATLLSAVGMLPDGPRRLRCVLAGDGELYGSLRDQIVRNGWADRMALLGFRDDVADLLGVADAFALPSLDEGMPIILLEAAFAGVPIVATPVGDVPKLVEDGVTGLLVPAGDQAKLAAALAHLRDDQCLAARLAAAASDRVRNEHSSDAMYSSYAEVYRDHVPA
jgi:glycosyltransferase involved in cell wall biosynthesis